LIFLFVWLNTTDEYDRYSRFFFDVVDVIGVIDVIDVIDLIQVLKWRFRRVGWGWLCPFRLK